MYENTVSFVYYSTTSHFSLSTYGLTLCKLYIKLFHEQIAFSTCVRSHAAGYSDAYHGRQQRPFLNGFRKRSRLFEIVFLILISQSINSCCFRSQLIDYLHCTNVLACTFYCILLHRGPCKLVNYVTATSTTSFVSGIVCASSILMLTKSVFLSR